jgi:hypothetical protein
MKHPSRTEKPHSVDDAESILSDACRSIANRCISHQKIRTGLILQPPRAGIPAPSILLRIRVNPFLQLTPRQLIL